MNAAHEASGSGDTSTSRPHDQNSGDEPYEEYQHGVFDQGQPEDDDEGTSVFDQDEPEDANRPGQGAFDQGHGEQAGNPGQGVYDQGHEERHSHEEHRAP